MTEKNNIDLSEENQYNTFAKYEPLLCDNCKTTLRVRMLPIKKALDSGQAPKMRHLIRLQSSLCKHCHSAVVQAKLEGK